MGCAARDALVGIALLIVLGIALMGIRLGFGPNFAAVMGVFVTDVLTLSWLYACLSLANTCSDEQNRAYLKRLIWPLRLATSLIPGLWIGLIAENPRLLACVYAVVSAIVSESLKYHVNKDIRPPFRVGLPLVLSWLLGLGLGVAFGIMISNQLAR